MRRCAILTRILDEPSAFVIMARMEAFKGSPSSKNAACDAKKAGMGLANGTSYT